MAHYRKIDIRIWNDHKFNQLSDDGKLVFFQLLSHPNLLPTGAMRGSYAGLASDLKWQLDRYKAAFNEILSHGMVGFDEASLFVWLPNFVKYNKPESPNVIKSWASYMDYLPECSLKDVLLQKVKSIIDTMSIGYREAFAEAFGKAMPNQEQEQEQKQEQEREITPASADAMPKRSLSKNIITQNDHTQQIHQSKAIEVLSFLNEKAEKNFEPTLANLKHILDRLKDGVSVEICRAIIANKVRAWKSEDKMKPNLNPVTLFRAENFDRYKGELIVPKEGDDDANE